MFDKEKRKSLTLKVKDLGVLGAFAGAIMALVLIGFYVVSRLSSERAYREQWKDYVDCGWA